MDFDVDRYLRYIDNRYPCLRGYADSCVAAFKDIKQKPYMFTVAAVSVFVLAVIIYSLPRPYIYENKRFGYYLVVPACWRKAVSRDMDEVTLTRRQPKSQGQAVVVIKAEMGNPYGTTAFDYAYYGLFKRLSYTYTGGRGRNTVFRIGDYPYNKRFSGLDWAVFSFMVDNKDSYSVYVTQKEDFVFTFTLTASGWSQDKAREEFLSMVKSVSIQRRERVNVFTDKDEKVLFSNPL